MLDIKCDKCKKPINKPAALVFSPPDSKQKVKKYHVCMDCWFYLEKYIEEDDE